MNVTNALCLPVQTSVGSWLLGAVLFLGVIVAFLPQIARIIRRKSGQGISPLSLFLNNIVNFALCFNELLLQFETFICCHGPNWTSIQCFAGLLPFFTIAIQPVMTCSCLVVFYCFFIPSDSPVVLGISDKVLNRLYIGVLTTFILCIVITVGFLVAPSNYPNYSAARVDLSFAMSALGAVGIVAVWVPQIIVTISRGDEGSLSFIMVLIVAVGSIIQFYFQAFEARLSWTTYVPYALAGVQQIILLIIIAVFMYRRRRRAKSFNSGGRTEVIFQDSSIQQQQQEEEEEAQKLIQKDQ